VTLHRPEIGEGTGNAVEISVRILVGNEACKVIVSRPGEPAQVQVVPHDEAAQAAGKAVEEIVAAGVGKTNR
jgi:hypothetical protein